MDKQRDIHFDVVTGVMIVYMILSHIEHNVAVPGFPHLIYVFFFFMPWFFYKAGVFYKQRTFMKECNGSLRRLILPFCYFTLLGVLCQSCILFHKGDTNWLHYVLTPLKEVLLAGTTTANQALWFLFDLFIIRCIYNCIMGGHKYSIKRLRALTLMGFSILLLVFEYFKLYDATMSTYIHAYVWEPINRLIPGLLFFAYGVFAQNKFHKNWMITLICLVVYLLIVIIKPSFVGCISDTLNEGGSYLFYVISTFAGLIIFDNVFSALCQYYSFPLLSKIGKFSMSLYVLHMPILNLLKEFFSFENYTLCLTTNLVVMFFVLPIIVVCIYRLNLQFVFGEKIKRTN